MSEQLRPVKKVKSLAIFGVIAVLASPVVGLDDEVSSLIHGAEAADMYESPDLTALPQSPELNGIGLKMKQDLTPYQVINPEWALQKAQEKGSSVYLGETISVEDAMRYNYMAGFRGWDLIVKTAIDGNESGYRPGSVGDVNWNLAGDRSVGTAQIYCQPNGYIKCEGIRDWRANFDPLVNAQHSYELYRMAINGPNHDNGLSNDGRFAPWRNNPDGIRDRIPAAEAAYENLSVMYGPLE